MRVDTASIFHDWNLKKGLLLWSLSVVCLLGVLAISYVVAGDVSIAFAGLALVMLGVLAFIRPKTGLGVLMAWTVFQYWFTNDFEVLPPSVVWLDEFLLAIVTFSWVGKKVPRREPLAKADLSIPLLLFAAVGLTSTVWNQNSPLVGLVGMRGLLQYVLVFFAIINLKPSEKEQKRLVGLMAVSAVLQIFVVLYQLAMRGGAVTAPSTQVASAGATAKTGDLVPGTFGLGGANNLGYFLSFAILFLLGRAYCERDRRWSSLIIAASLTVPWLFCSARGSYWAFPMALALILFLEAGKKPGLKRVVLWIVPFTALTSSGVVEFISGAWGQVVKTQTTPYSPRLLYYREVYAILRRSGLLTFLTGLGPGMLGSYTARVFGSYYDRLLRGMFGHGTIWTNMGNDSQVVAIFAEFGLIGLIFAGWIVVRMIQSARRLLLVKSAWSRTVAIGGLSAAFTFAFASATTNAWEVQPIAVWVWMFSGLVQLHKNQPDPSQSVS